MRSFWWVMVAATLGVQSAFAENTADTPDNRQAAAERYLEAVPMESIMDDVVAATVGQLPEDQRADFVKLMTETVRWDLLERAALSSMVRHFTVRELNALADFYGSPEGRSAAKKFGAYMADVMPTVQQELSRAFQRLESTKQ